MRKSKKCTQPGCHSEYLAKGLCVKHYSEQGRRAKGVPEMGEPKPHHIEFMSTTALRDRFFALVPRRQRSEVLRRALEAELLKIKEELGDI